MADEVTTVYKVVREYAWINRFFSAYSNYYDGTYDYEVEYKVGEPTFPKIAGTKLFAFRTLKAARNYVFGGGNVVIFRCEATGVISLPMAASHYPAIPDFWRAMGGERERLRSPDVMRSPSWTVGCDSITLLERMEE
jgi:hypothetical protein